MHTVLVITIVIGVGLAGTGCNQTTTKQPSKADPYAASPLHTSYGVNVVFNDSSAMRATLAAGVAVVNETQMVTTLSRGVHVTFYSRSTGKKAAVLDADSASIDERTKDMTAFGNVVVKSDSSQTTLRTSQLVWVQKEERIRTTHPVRITTPTEVIDGVGMVSDQLLTDYRIFKVKGVHHP